jgi:hypothetical protein
LFNERAEAVGSDDLAKSMHTRVVLGNGLSPLPRLLQLFLQLGGQSFDLLPNAKVAEHGRVLRVDVPRQIKRPWHADQLLEGADLAVLACRFSHEGTRCVARSITFFVCAPTTRPPLLPGRTVAGGIAATDERAGVKAQARPAASVATVAAQVASIPVGATPSIAENRSTLTPAGNRPGDRSALLVHSNTAPSTAAKPRKHSRWPSQLQAALFLSTCARPLPLVRLQENTHRSCGQYGCR